MQWVARQLKAQPAGARELKQGEENSQRAAENAAAATNCGSFGLGPGAHSVVMFV